MRIQILVTGLLMLGLGAVSMAQLDEEIGLQILQGSLLLGGGLIICGLFSLRMRWHGIAGAGVLGLLGAARGLANLPGFFQWLNGDQSRGFAPVIELAFTLLCAVLMFRVMRALQRERTRRLLAQGGPDSA